MKKPSGMHGAMCQHTYQKKKSGKKISKHERGGRSNELFILQWRDVTRQDVEGILFKKFKIKFHAW